MENEKKRRVRPTLTQMRGLEAKYNALKEEYDSQQMLVCQLKERISQLEGSNMTLDQSNRLMEKGIDALRKNIDSLECVVKEKVGELCRLKNRGFFKRLFNIS